MLCCCGAMRKLPLPLYACTERYTEIAVDKKKERSYRAMTTWSYKAFESSCSGREAITELEQNVSEELEALSLRAVHAKVAMTNIIEGTARAVIFYPDAAIQAAPAAALSGWTKADTNTIADSSDTERYEEEMYQGIIEILNVLPDAQTARSKITTTDYKGGYATTSIWYPTKVA